MAAIRPAIMAAIPIDALSQTALLTAAGWLSPAFPTGGFAWSHGLEQAIRDGAVADAAGLADWLAALLTHGAARSDAILLCLAHRAEGAELADLADLAAALCPSRERRMETMGQGAAFAGTLRAVRGFDLPDMPYPVAVGRAAALAGLPAQPVAALFVQAMLTNLVQAAQRLMPLGQTAAQGLLHGLLPAMVTCAAEAATATADDLGTAVLAGDSAAMRHETLQPRIFRS